MVGLDLGREGKLVGVLYIRQGRVKSLDGMEPGYSVAR